MIVTFNKASESVKFFQEYKKSFDLEDMVGDIAEHIKDAFRNISKTFNILFFTPIAAFIVIMNHVSNLFPLRKEGSVPDTENKIASCINQEAKKVLIELRKDFSDKNKTGTYKIFCTSHSNIALKIES